MHELHYVDFNEELWDEIGFLSEKRGSKAVFGGQSI